jgi:hypothetical protein
MLENQLEDRFRRRIKAAGGQSVKIVSSVRGVPDRMVLHDGDVFLVELKTDTGKLSASQVVWHARAADVGVKVVVLRGKAQLDCWTHWLTVRKSNG